MDRLLAVLLLISSLSFSCVNTPSPADKTQERQDAAEAQRTLTTEDDTISAVPPAGLSKETMQEKVQKPVVQQPVPVKTQQRKENEAVTTTPPAKPAPPATPVSSPASSPAMEAVTETATEAKPPVAVSDKPDHSTWDALLQRYVSATGKVNYEGLKKEQDKLQAYLNELAAHPVQNDWSRNEKMAYWINAYNAFTVKLILDNYPVSSITKLHGGKPWDVKWIPLGDKTYSLNQIEHDILRPQFRDPRIHFAVNCAAQSCPPLLNRAWTADNLNSYLQRQSRYFINNPKYNTIQARKVTLSRIFEWYAADFDDLIAFINRYSDTQVASDAEIAYNEYDWALNN